MKFKLMLFAVLLSFVLCVPAMAEVKTFGDITVDVPTGWMTQEVPAAAGKGVALMAPDGSATVTIAIVPSKGMTVKAMADAQAQAIGGKVEEEDGVYHISGKVQGMDANYFVSEADGGEVAMISVAGDINNAGVQTILNSVE